MKKLLLQCFLLVIPMIVLAQAQNSYNMGESYYQKRDGANALKYYTKAAEKGNAKAACRLGDIYTFNKTEIKADDYLAHKWYLRAAELGDVRGMANVGEDFFFGKGTEQDHNEANKWFAKAVDRGNKYSRAFIGWYYYTGEFGVKDYNKAFQIWRESRSENTLSHYFLGRYYYDGKAIEPNYNEAFACFLRVLNTGNDERYAHLYLGHCYFYGRGTEYDFETARKNYILAADQNVAEAKEMLDHFDERKAEVEVKIAEEKRIAAEKKAEEDRIRRAEEVKRAAAKAEQDAKAEAERKAEAARREAQRLKDNELKKKCEGKKIYWTEVVTYEVPHDGLLEFMLNMNEIKVDVTYEAIVEKVIAGQSVKCIISNVYIDRNGRWNPKWDTYRGAITERLMDRIGKTRVLSFDEFNLK